MTLLAVIQLLLFVNMALFLVAFSLLAQPSMLVQNLLDRFLEYHEDTPPEVIERFVRQALHVLGVLGCAAVFGWATLTSFVITLYKAGYFWRF